MLERSTSRAAEWFLMKVGDSPSEGTFNWMKDVRFDGHSYRLYGLNDRVALINKKNEVLMIMTTPETILLGLVLIVEWPLRHLLGAIWRRALKLKVDEIAEMTLQQIRDDSLRKHNLSLLRGMSKWGTVLAQRPKNQ